ncbi:MAG: tetratricopeptide repeat protein [Bacteroidales bacterium]|nr:tetratricopeptide repeat protein [Bacteroidales bacterium]
MLIIKLKTLYFLSVKSIITLLLLVSYQIISPQYSLANSFNQIKNDACIDSLDTEESIKDKENNYYIDSLIQKLDTESVDSIKLKLYNKIANHYYEKEPAKSIPYDIAAIELAKKTNNKNYLRTFYNRLGLSYYYMANINSAVKLFFESLKLMEEANDSIGISSLLNNIGLAYLSGECFEKAIEYFSAAQALNIKLNILDELWISYVNIGIANAELKRYDDALKSYLLAMENLERLNEEKDDRYAFIIGEMGRLDLKLDKFDEAETHFLESLFYNRKARSTYREAEILNHLCVIYIKTNKLSKAHDFAEKSINKAKEAGAINVLYNCYSNLSEIEELRGNYKLSLEYYKESTIIGDSLASQKNMDNIYQVQEIFLIEKQEAKDKLLRNEIELNKTTLQKRNVLIFSFIAILILMIFLAILLVKNVEKGKKNNEILSKQHEIISIYNEELMAKQEVIEHKAKELEGKNKDLVVLNTQKDKFYSIISHDLRSSVGAIVGFSNLLIDRYDILVESKRKKYTTMISKSAESTMDLLINLLEWSRSQQDNTDFNPETIDLYEMVSNVMYFTALISDKKSIKTIIQIEKNTLVFGDKGMIFTIFRNLIINAIKFTPLGGKVIVSAENKRDKFIIHVQDFGVGISEDVKSKLFDKGEVYSTLGTEDESGTGLGLKLCKEFVEKHNQEIGVISSLDQGSDFWFTLEKADEKEF